MRKESFPEFLSRKAGEIRGLWKEIAAASASATGVHTFLTKYGGDAYTSMLTKDNAPLVLVGVIAVVLLVVAGLYIYHDYFTAAPPDTALTRLANLTSEPMSEAAPDLRLVTAEQWPVVRGDIETLDEMETVKPGDKLVFALTPKREGYAYLLHVNEVTGRIKVMWPNKRDRDNAVRPKESLTVPQKGPDYIKVATGDAGLETFFLIECSAKLEDAMPPQLTPLPENLGDLSDEQAKALLNVLEVRCRAAADRPGIAKLEVRSVAA